MMHSQARAAFNLLHVHRELTGEDRMIIAAAMREQQKLIAKQTATIEALEQLLKDQQNDPH